MRYTAFLIHSDECKIAHGYMALYFLTILCCQILCNVIDDNLKLDSKWVSVPVIVQLCHLFVLIVGVNSLKNVLLNKIYR